MRLPRLGQTNIKVRIEDIPWWTKSARPNVFCFSTRLWTEQRDIRDSSFLLPSTYSVSFLLREMKILCEESIRRATMRSFCWCESMFAKDPPLWLDEKDIILITRKCSFRLQIKDRLTFRNMPPIMIRTKRINLFHQLRSKSIDSWNRERSLWRKEGKSNL